MARTNRIRILNAVASSSFIYRRPTITILVRITASRKGEERAGNDRRYAPCIAGRGHDSVDWIDFRKAGTMVVSERNWIASGCSPDKKRIVSIRRRRENGNRRGNGGGEEVLQKKKGRDSISWNEILSTFSLSSSPPFSRRCFRLDRVRSPLRFLLRSMLKRRESRDESDWIVGKLVSFLRGLLDIFFFRSRFPGTMGGKN